MSAQPTPFVENRADYERSVQWARDRANAGDETLEICPVCMCEVDVDPQPHRPGCPEIGKPRSSSAPVLAVLATVTRAPAPRPPVRAGAAFNDGLDALERMDAGLPQQPEVDLDEPDDDLVLEEEPAVGQTAVSGAAAALGEPERVGSSSSTARATWSRASIVAAIVRWNDEHGEPPTSTQWMKKIDGCPSLSTVLSHFGSWSAGIVAAGFEPRKRGGQRLTTQDSSSERAVDPEPEEGPRSPTPDAGGLDEQQPPMGARTADATDAAGVPEPGPGPDRAAEHDADPPPEPTAPIEHRDVAIITAAIDTRGEARLTWIERMEREARRSRVRADALEMVAEGLRILDELHQDEAA